MNGWIGFDLDGTLAIYDKWEGPEHIGEPIMPMVELAKKFIGDGYEVKIFTARISSNNPERMKSIDVIMQWSKKVFGRILPMTAEKDYGMIDLYDDRCHRVECNTGRILA